MNILEQKVTGYLLAYQKKCRDYSQEEERTGELRSARDTVDEAGHTVEGVFSGGREIILEVSITDCDGYGVSGDITLSMEDAYKLGKSLVQWTETAQPPKGSDNGE